MSNFAPVVMTTDDLSLSEINGRMIAAANAIREALDEYRRANREWVEAVRKFKKAHSVAFLQATAKTVPGKEAEVTLVVDEQWYEAELAGVLRDSSKEALRANEAILNGLQSVSAAYRADANFAKWSPQEVQST